MSRLAAIFGVLVVLVCGEASAQQWAKRMFTQLDHDFGTVARGAKSEYEFELKNIFKEDVHLSSVTSSCGCTSPSITKQDLKTYEVSSILAKFNTRTFLGQRGATLTVTIDKPYYAQVQLHVKGYIRSDVVLEPGGVEFGSVDHGATAEKTIDISYAGRGNWKILEAKSGSDYLDTSVKETRRKDGRVSYQLVVKLKEDAPPGYIKEQIVLLTNDQKSKEVPVDVEGQIVTPITVSPSTLFLGAVKPGQKVTKLLVIQGRKPFKVVDVKCEQDCFQFTLPTTAKRVHKIPVTFEAAETAGKMSYKIEITTDLQGDDAVQTLPAFAQVLAANDELTSSK